MMILVILIITMIIQIISIRVIIVIIGGSVQYRGLKATQRPWQSHKCCSSSSSSMWQHVVCVKRHMGVCERLRESAPPISTREASRCSKVIGCGALVLLCNGVMLGAIQLTDTCFVINIMTADEMCVTWNTVEYIQYTVLCTTYLYATSQMLREYWFTLL